MFKSAVISDPESDWKRDLVGDSFLASWKGRPVVADADDVAPSRALNQELLNWTLEKAEFQKARANTVGNLPASLMSSSLLWETLITDKALENARKAQEEAEQKQKEAEQHYKEMAEQQAAGNQQGAQEAQQAGQQAQQQANAAAQAVQQSIQKLKDNPLGQGMMAKAISDASQEGEKVATAMRTWGIEPGEVAMDDMDDVQKLASMSDLRELADLIGRFEGVATNASQAVKAGYTGTVTKPDTTKDVTRLFPLERAFLSEIAPRYVRIQRLQRLVVGGGLLGWKPKTEGKRRGSFVAMVDKSSSMTWGGGPPITIAKGVALGIARALMADQTIVDREFTMHYFDASDVESMKNLPYVTNRSHWKEFVEWASMRASGGTRFDTAVMFAIEKLRELADRGVHGADLLFITDEESRLSDETILAWNNLKEEIGCNLILVSITGNNQWMDSQIKEVADLAIAVDSANFDSEADDIVKQITTTIVKGELSGYGDAGGD
jgi:uncharacterized protein with von Willebrand factor type A (vWA) domain